jgi:ABC-type lipoprotein export system ATPase subunit
MIEVRGLSYQYSSGKRIKFDDFEVSKGTQWLLLGESGSGKTTLLHLMSGLLKSQQGKIIIQGTDITQLSESKLDHFRGANMGFVFQKNHLINALTVKRNLLMAPFLARLKQDEDRVDDVLRELALEEKKNSRINELSQGQAQRVAIARSVLNKPTVIFADEPTSALDDRNCERVIRLLLNAAQLNHATLIVATHDQRLKSIIPNQLVLNNQ